MAQFIVSNAKALAGAIFINYFIYAIIYIIEEFKDRIVSKTPAQQPKKEEEQKSQDDMHKSSEMEGRASSVSQADLHDVQPHIADDEDEKPLGPKVIENFTKHMMFYITAVAFCMYRAPADYSVVIAYLAILFKALQVFGYYCKKRFMVNGGQVCHSLCTVTLFMMTLITEIGSDIA